MIEKLDEEEKQLKMNKTFDNQLKKHVGSSLLNAVTIADIGRTPSGVQNLPGGSGTVLTEGNLALNCQNSSSDAVRSSFISSPSGESVIVTRIIRANEESTHEDRKGITISDDESKSSRR